MAGRRQAGGRQAGRQEKIETLARQKTTDMTIYIVVPGNFKLL